MRFIFDCMICLMLVSILAAVIHYHRQNSRHEASYQIVQHSLRQLREQVNYQRALGLAQTREATFPAEIDVEWFGKNLPMNVLVSTGQPWMDAAPLGDLSAHPPDPVIQQDAQAGFWYNPNTGRFRARVEQKLSEKQTLQGYNRANGSSLTQLVFSSDPSRMPTRVICSDGQPFRLHASVKTSDAVGLKSGSPQVDIDGSERGKNLGRRTLSAKGLGAK